MYKNKKNKESMSLEFISLLIPAWFIKYYYTKLPETVKVEYLYFIFPGLTLSSLISLYHTWSYFIIPDLTLSYLISLYHTWSYLYHP